MFILVTAPSGQAIQINSTSDLGILGFESCGGTIQQCVWNSTKFAPTETNLRVFGITHDDSSCGDFSISVTAQ